MGDVGHVYVYAKKKREDGKEAIFGNIIENSQCVNIVKLSD